MQDTPVNSHSHKATSYKTTSYSTGVLPFIAVIAPLFSAVAKAENTTELPPAVVWGTSIESSSIHISPETLRDRQADHISDLLRPLPGVDVGGAHSLNQRITLRSMDDKDIRISIDGANQNNYMYHHMGNLQIHADILEAVSIDVGKNSVIYGGLGGAVRFNTKSAADLLQPGKQFGGQIHGSYSDNASNSVALTGYGQLTEQLDFLAYINRVDRDNFEVGGGTIKDAQGEKVAGTDGSVRGLEGELDDALLKLGWDLSSQQRLELGYEFYNDEGDYSYRPDMGIATDLAIVGRLGIPLVWPTKFSRNTFTANYELEWGNASTLEATLYRNASELERDETGFAISPRFAGSAGIVTGNADNTGLRVMAESQLTTGTLQHGLTYGGEYIKYDTDSQTIDEGNSVSATESSKNMSVYIEDRIALSPMLTLVPGIRYDNVKVNANVVDDTFDEITGSLKAQFNFGDKIQLEVSSTQLFQAPELAEVFIGAGANDLPNPDIKAETGLNSEIGGSFSDTLTGNDTLSVGATFFKTTLNDFLYDYATPPAGSSVRSWKDNIGDMTLDGYEAYVSYENGGFSALLSISATDSELDAFADYSDLDKHRIDREQGDTTSLSLDYRMANNSIRLHWDMQVVDDLPDRPRIDGATANTAKSGFTLHNVSATWMPAQISGLSLTFGVDNLLDEYYASHSSRTGVSRHPFFGDLYLLDYEPGRNIKVSAAYKL